MSINSKQKGKRGELEICGLLKNYGYNVRRSVQYNGKAQDGQADVVGLPGIHMEIKRVEKLNLHDAMAQAVRDAKEGETPAVFHRKNNKGWLVTLRMEDYMKMYGGIKSAESNH